MSEEKPIEPSAPLPEQEDPRSTSRRGVYYHRKVPYYASAPYAASGGSPAYYGGSPYGTSSGYYANPYYGKAYGGGEGGEDDGSMFGTFSPARLWRVCISSWVTILVFMVIGVIASTIVFKLMPVIYESVCKIEMSIRAPRIVKGSGAFVDDNNVGGSSMEEVFNTRLARLSSRELFENVIRRYRSDNPSSMIDNEQLISTLAAAKMELVRRSRLITITVRSTDAQLATDLANAYAQSAETFSYDQNKADSESAVAWLKTQAEALERSISEQDAVLLDFRKKNAVDVLQSKCEVSRSAIAAVDAEIRRLQSQEALANELLKTLDAIQTSPEKFSSLPDSIPRSAEISTVFANMQQAETALKTLLTRLTTNHPDVKVKEKELEVYKEQFADAVNRARETAAANLALVRNQISPLEDRQKDLMDELTRNEQSLVTAQMGIQQMERSRTVAVEQHSALLQRIAEAQLAIDENTTTIRLVEKALVPNKPVSPNPFIVFPAGPILGFVIGILFVMALDHLEDKIIGTPDIENRLRLKVLGVLPHIRRKTREQMALISHEDKFSLYAEGISSLRNLLDSPRYVDVSHVLLCMSTQPGEGKTVTATNLALVCANSGQKTLLVDFDLRRPRLAHIFKKSSRDYKSLSHVLVQNDATLFDSLPTNVGIPDLDVILTKASSEISPASLMGTGIITEFFTWAREHYDRVIIDSPPFGVVSDVMVLGNLADAVIMMCCPDRTRYRPIKFAVRSLTEAGARILGAVVNDVDFGRGTTFSQYDDHYRYSYRYSTRYGAYGYSKKAIIAQEEAEKRADQKLDGTQNAGEKGMPSEDDEEAPHTHRSSRSDAVDPSMYSEDDE